MLKQSSVIYWFLCREGVNMSLNPIFFFFFWSLSPVWLLFPHKNNCTDVPQWLRSPAGRAGKNPTWEQLHSARSAHRSLWLQSCWSQKAEGTSDLLAHLAGNSRKTWNWEMNSLVCHSVITIVWLGKNIQTCEMNAVISGSRHQILLSRIIFVHDILCCLTANVSHGNSWFLPTEKTSCHSRATQPTDA